MCLPMYEGNSVAIKGCHIAQRGCSCPEGDVCFVYIGNLPRNKTVPCQDIGGLSASGVYTLYICVMMNGIPDAM